MPLDPHQQRLVLDRTGHMVDLAAAAFGLKLQTPAVSFDLKGRAAGMFRVRSAVAEIRYNPWIFARWFQQNLAETVPHEVAHFVVYSRYRRRMRPHGPEWREVMQLFGVPPRVTCDYRPEDIADLPGRRLRYFDYTCDCTTHRVSSIRHNRMAAGKAHYQCRRCHGSLRPAD